MSQVVENPLTCNVGETFRKFLDSGPEAGDFQNSVSSFLFISKSVVKCSHRSVQ